MAPDRLMLSSRAASTLLRAAVRSPDSPSSLSCTAKPTSLEQPYQDILQRVRGGLAVTPVEWTCIRCQQRDHNSFCTSKTAQHD